MATRSRSSRASAGIALIIAGVLFVLAIVLPLMGVGLPWLGVIAYAAMAVALVLLALGVASDPLARIALYVGALGWALLALSGFGLALPAGFVTLGVILAAVGGLVAAIVLFVRKGASGNAALAFLIAAVLGALFLLNSAGLFALGTFGTVIAALFGAALIYTGYLFRSRGSKR